MGTLGAKGSHPFKLTVYASGRANSHSFMYFRMCANAIVRYKGLYDKLSTINHPHLCPCHDALIQELEEASVEPVIYAGMCVESTLYDLGACLFGDAFVEHTEKLGPLEKYYIIAKLVDKVAPDKSSITYQSIKKLVTARNKLVHHRSQSALNLDFSEIYNRTKKQHDQHIAGISSSFKALVLLSLHFDGNIFETLRIIPSFKKPEYWNQIVPKELHGEVEWCIKKAGPHVAI